jgi:hypothetical protein
MHRNLEATSTGDVSPHEMRCEMNDLREPSACCTVSRRVAQRGGDGLRFAASRPPATLGRLGDGFASTTRTLFCKLPTNYVDA